MVSVPPDESAAEPPPELPMTDAQLARRAQILATEHWGLLAARSTAQSEVLTRITIFLTLVSAGLLTIGLLGQATKFAGWFPTASLAILGFLCVIGLLTQVRVMLVMEEDLMYVVAMNRIRGGYVDLDPGVARYFLASINDDQSGMRATYSFLHFRGPIGQLTGSSSVLSMIVNASVVGMFAAGIATVSGLAIAWAITIGVAAAAVVIAVSVTISNRRFFATWKHLRSLRPTTGPPPHWMP